MDRFLPDHIGLSSPSSPPTSIWVQVANSNLVLPWKNKNPVWKELDRCD
jgi:hypothetical protein